MSVTGPEVIFYAPLASWTKSRAHGACYVAAEYWRCRRSLCLYAADRKAADELDGLLWTFTDTEFVPHSLFGQEGHGIVIGWDDQLPAETDFVVNMAENLPASLSTFSRIIEIVPPDTAERKKARRRYRQGQEMGWKLEYRELTDWKETL